MEGGFSLQVALALVAVALTAVVYVVFFKSKEDDGGKQNGGADNEEESEDAQKKGKRGKKNKNQEQGRRANKAVKKMLEANRKGKGKNKRIPDPTDPLFVSALKGHVHPILDARFTPNGKAFATTSEDRTMRLWSTATFETKDHAFVSSKVDLDHISHFAFSTDGKAAAGVLARDRLIRLFKVSTKAGFTPVTDLPQDLLGVSVPVVNIGMVANQKHKYILVCLGDTTVLLLTPRGEVLEKIDTQLGRNYWASVSDCGNFIACSGFAPGVKLWAVESEYGKFVQTRRCMHLGGHSGGTAHFCFSRDSAMAATVAADGTWRCFDINVRWQDKEDPHLLSHNTYAHPSDAPRIAISSSNYTLCVGSQQSLEIFSVHTGDRLYAVKDAHAAGAITHLCYDFDDEYIVSVAHTRAHIWRNTPHKREMIARLKEKLKNARHATVKGRIQEQLDELEQALNKRSK